MYFKSENINLSINNKTFHKRTTMMLSFLLVPRRAHWVENGMECFYGFLSTIWAYERTVNISSAWLTTKNYRRNLENWFSWKFQYDLSIWVETIIKPKTFHCSSFSFFLFFILLLLSLYLFNYLFDLIYFNRRKCMGKGNT